MVTPGTAENVLISEVPHFRGTFRTPLYLVWSLDSVLNKEVSLFQCVFLYRGFTVVHAVGGIYWICLTLDIFLIQTGTILMYFAAKNNHPRLVELLLAHGADINKVNLKLACG